MSEHDEQTFQRTGDCLVTSSRIQFENQTFATRNVSDVSVVSVRAAIQLFMALALGAGGPVAAQVYKCPHGGGTLFQQHPCDDGQAINVRPASGHDAPAALAPDAPGRTRVEQINARSDALAADRQLRHYERRAIPDLLVAIDDNRARCAAQEQALRDEQAAYVQNLWGKTHSAEMASEITSLKLECDRTERDLQAEYREAVMSCHDLGGCAQYR